MKKMSKDTQDKLGSIKLLGIVYTIVALATVLDLIGVFYLDGTIFMIFIVVEIMVGIIISKLIGSVSDELNRTQGAPFGTLIEEYNKQAGLGFLGLGFLHTIGANKVEEEGKKYEAHTDTPKEEKETSIIDVISYMNKEKEKTDKIR